MPSHPLTAQATSDGSGNITFPFFETPPQGRLFQGTVSVPSAPISAQFSAVLSGLGIGTFAGFNPWGPAQVRAGERLQISGSGLVAATAYTAIWMIGDYPQDAAPAPPVPYGSVTQINNSTSNPVSVTVLQLPAPPAAMNFSVVITGNGSAQQVSGTSVPLKTGLAFLADTANAGNFHIGASSVSAGSAYLAPGQGVVIPISDADIIWVLGTNGDHLSVWGA